MSEPHSKNRLQKRSVFLPMSEEFKGQAEASGELPAPAIGPPPPSPSPVLFGPHGLRAGWRLLCYVGLVMLTAWSLRIAGTHLLQHNIGGLWSNLLGEVGGVVAAFIPAPIMGRVEKRRFGVYGLPAKGAFGRNFWVGSLWGFAAISLLLLAIGALGDFSASGLALHGERILKLGAFWAFVFLCVGLFEEFLARGYAQFTLAQGIGFWPAAVLLSVAFGALHLGNPGENRVGIVAVVMIALFFCLTLRRTGNLWFAVGFHAAFDWGESYFYSVPDSGSVSPGHLLNSSFHGSHWITGGTDGPEGSLFILVLIVVLCLAFVRAYPEVRYDARNT